MAHNPSYPHFVHGESQILGPSGSGKTTLLYLAIDALRHQSTTRIPPIHFLPAWDVSKASKAIGNGGYLFIDDAQGLYQEIEAWKQVLTTPSTMGLFGVVVASSKAWDEYPITNSMLTREEFDEFMLNRGEQLSQFAEDFYDYLFICTAGHVGAISEFVYLVKTLQVQWRPFSIQQLTPSPPEF